LQTPLLRAAILGQVTNKNRRSFHFSLSSHGGQKSGDITPRLRHYDVDRARHHHCLLVLETVLSTRIYIICIYFSVTTDWKQPRAYMCRVPCPRGLSRVRVRPAIFPAESTAQPWPSPRVIGHHHASQLACRTLAFQKDVSKLGWRKHHGFVGTNLPCVTLHWLSHNDLGTRGLYPALGTTSTPQTYQQGHIALIHRRLSTRVTIGRNASRICSQYLQRLPRLTQASLPFFFGIIPRSSRHPDD
jgi:hypothetical protein